MRFIPYSPIKSTVIDSIDTQGNGIRYYKKEGISYPSVSTIINYFRSDYSKKFLKNWSKNETNKLKSQLARTFGTAFHKENNLIMTGQKGYVEGHPFQKFFDTIHFTKASELEMVSPYYGVGGTLDLLFEDYKGNIVLVDYKTSNGDKKREQVQEYLDQAALYSLLVEKEHDIKVKYATLWVLPYDVDVTAKNPEFKLRPAQEFKLENGYFDRRKEKMTQQVEDYHFMNF